MSKLDPSWPDGPWDQEDDGRKWQAHGLACEVNRTQWSGSLCGYVTVPKGHPAYGMASVEVPVSVHGGVTFAKEAVSQSGLNPGQRWMFGFDCAHAWDLAPGHQSELRIDGTYREWGYVVRETEKLAAQLLAMVCPDEAPAIGGPGVPA